MATGCAFGKHHEVAVAIPVMELKVSDSSCPARGICDCPTSPLFGSCALTQKPIPPYYMTMVVTMVSKLANRIVKASEFKARCLKLMDEVAATGETITVTKNGRPVAELRPIERPRRGFFGRNRGQIVIHGDLDDYKMDWEMQG